MDTPLSPRKYAESGPNCPNCGSPSLESDDREQLGTTIEQRTTCTDCNYEWIDIFQLTGYDHMTDDEGNEIITAFPEE